jgi:hypothetical protein
MIEILKQLDEVITLTSMYKLDDDSIRTCFYKLSCAVKMLTEIIAAEEGDRR